MTKGHPDDPDSQSPQLPISKRPRSMSGRMDDANLEVHEMCHDIHQKLDSMFKITKTFNFPIAVLSEFNACFTRHNDRPKT